MSDDAIVCLCQKVTKKDIVDAVKKKDCATIADTKRGTTAGAERGGCILRTGYVPKVLKSALAECGKKLFAGIGAHFPFSRRELFEIMKLKELKTYDEVIEACAGASKIPDLQEVTGAQRIGLFGANGWQLPSIWKKLCYGRSPFVSVDGKAAAKVETAAWSPGTPTTRRCAQ